VYEALTPFLHQSRFAAFAKHELIKANPKQQIGGLIYRVN
jgi:hypothetical protein